MAKIITTKDFIQKSNILHNNKYDYSKTIYIKSKEKVEIICLEHGSFWQSPNNHLHGQGCPKCGAKLISQKNSLSLKEFIDRSNIAHRNKYDYSKVIYTNVYAKVIIICPIHGEFKQTAKDHMDGFGCIKCSANKNELDLFNCLKLYFEHDNILFQYSPKWLESQKFDIYFPDYNIAVEYNGIQHYKAIDHFGGEDKFKYQKQLDCIKEQKCLNNSCKLYKLKYNHTKTELIEMILNIKKWKIGLNLE